MAIGVILSFACARTGAAQAQAAATAAARKALRGADNIVERRTMALSPSRGLAARAGGGPIVIRDDETRGTSQGALPRHFVLGSPASPDLFIHTTRGRRP